MIKSKIPVKVKAKPAEETSESDPSLDGPEEETIEAAPVEKAVEKVVKKASTSVSLTAEDIATIAREAAKGAIEALKAPAKADASTSELMEKAMVGMSEEDKESFKASFGGGNCPTCGQIAVKGRYPCKGKHRMMVVFPKDEHWAKWFQGCFLGGVKYLSDNSGHQVPVPAENDFESQIAAWVETERVNAQGKKKSWNSGSINGTTGNTQGFNPFNGPGFR